MTPDIRSIEDLNRLIEDGAAEGPFLEFKSAGVLAKENDKLGPKRSIAVTALANGGGGQFIIGLAQDKGSSRPIRLDPIMQSKQDAEWLSRLLETRIRPPIPDLSFRQIAVPEGGHVLVIAVPQSEAGPHQACDGRYYARRQAQNLSMAHHEIEDVRNRARVRPPPVFLGIRIDRGVFVELVVENRGEEVVSTLRFEMPEPMRRVIRSEAPALTEGLTALNPGERMAFCLGEYPTLHAADALKIDNAVAVTFRDSAGRHHRRSITVNLLNHDRTALPADPLDDLRQALVQEIRSLRTELARAREEIGRPLRRLGSPTGLALSDQAVDDLAAALRGLSARARRNALGLDPDALRELLDCDIQQAHDLSRHLDLGRLLGPRPVADLPEDLLARARARLFVPGEPF